MRKAIPCLLLLLLLLACAPALAETYVFDQLYATMEMPEGYIVLTPDNLNNYSDWLEARGSSMEIASNDFLARGVLLQAWTEEGDACFELRAVQNERSASIFDVNEQTSDVRGVIAPVTTPITNTKGTNSPPLNGKIPTMAASSCCATPGATTAKSSTAALCAAPFATATKSTLTCRSMAALPPIRTTPISIKSGRPLPL